MMNLTDYKLMQDLYNGASNAHNYTSTLSTSFLNATYNFNYSGIPGTVKNFVFNDASFAMNTAAEYTKQTVFSLKVYLAQKTALAIESATNIEYLSESTKTEVAAAAAKASELNAKAYNFVTEDAPEAIYEYASTAVNQFYAAGSYMNDNLVAARDTAANKAQETVSVAYNNVQSITEQCTATEICANAMDAAPYAAAGVAALAAVGIAYKLYGYMQGKQEQPTLVEIAATNEPELVKPAVEYTEEAAPALKLNVA